MSTLSWNEELMLGHAQMDRTHEEFVALLAAAEAALPRLDRGAILDAFRALIVHTQAHFDQEERWMADCGFDAENCHSRQHAMVLKVMADVETLARDAGEMQPLARIVAELAEWFPQHAQMMDAALAEQMAQRGYDPLTRQQAHPAPEAAPITGCGSQSCS